MSHCRSFLTRCDSLYIGFDSLWVLVNQFGLVAIPFWLVVTPCDLLWVVVGLLCSSRSDPQICAISWKPPKQLWLSNMKSNIIDNFIEPRSILKQFCIWLVEVGNANKQLSVSKKNLFYVQDFNDWSQTVIFLNFKFRRSWFPLSQEYHFVFRFSKCFTVCHTYKKLFCEWQIH